MPRSLVKAESLLAMDVGSLSTRVSLFDVVDARYRYLGSGVAQSTANAPYNDIGEGIHQAIEQLQTITGRVLFDADGKLITPERVDGSGVDVVVATVSAGPPIKTIVAGLLEDISVESAARLASSINAQVITRLSLSDHRSNEERLNLILQSKPDLILAAGGSDHGAEQAVMRLLETVGLACMLMPEDSRPEILFVGNSAIQEKVRHTMGAVGTVHFAPNIRPTLEVEELSPARVELANAYRRIRRKQMPGFYELDQWTNGGVLPPSHGWERVVRVLSKAYDPKKGVLGVDLGASAVTLAAGLGGEAVVGVYPQFGLSNPFLRNLEQVSLAGIHRWLMHDLPLSELRNILLTRQIFPASLPMTEEELDVELALAKVMLQSSMKEFLPRVKGLAGGGEFPILPAMEPVLASGSLLTQAARLAHSAMTLLDGIQPTRITTLILDQHHLIPTLGAAAAANPVLAVQAMDFGTLLNLATVIAPVGRARPGTTILKVKISDEDGREQKLDVRYGSLHCIPLPVGKSLQLHLQPYHGFDIGMGGAGVGGRVRLAGSALGVIIDARGRPLQLPRDAQQRREMLKRWMNTLEKK